MKFKVSVFTLMLAFVTSFAFANSSVTPDFDQTATELSIDLNELGDITSLSVSYEEEACTVTVTVDVLGNGGTISATADTCKEAVQQVKEGLAAILN